jgi:rubredoxin
MKCGFCGHEFDESEGKKGCGGCPGGCHSLHCPRCNYKNPLEPALLKSIRKLFNKNDTHSNKGE